MTKIFESDIRLRYTCTSVTADISIKRHLGLAVQTQIRHIEVFSNLHTHPSNGPFSAITRLSRYQKGKTNLDFTEARDSEW